MNSWAFTAIETPKPQGSKEFKGFTKSGRAILTESSKGVKSWRATVTDAAYGCGDKLLGPVAVHVVFTLPRPKYVPKRETLPQRGIDVDKAVRAVFDSVTAAGLWEDDSRVCVLLAEKRWPLDPRSLPVPGVVIAACDIASHDDYEHWPILRALVSGQHHVAWGRYEGAA